MMSLRAEDERRIRRNWSLLKQDLHVEDFIQQFVDLGVFPPNLRNDIMNVIPNTASMKGEKFLNAIIASGNRSYQVLCALLRRYTDNRYSSVIEALAIPANVNMDILNPTGHASESRPSTAQSSASSGTINSETGERNRRIKPVAATNESPSSTIHTTSSGTPVAAVAPERRVQQPVEQNGTERSVQQAGAQNSTDRRAQQPGEQNSAGRQRVQQPGEQNGVERRAQQPGEQNADDRRVQQPGEQNATERRDQHAGEQNSSERQAELPNEQNGAERRAQQPSEENNGAERGASSGESTTNATSAVFHIPENVISNSQTVTVGDTTSVSEASAYESDQARESSTVSISSDSTVDMKALEQELVRIAPTIADLFHKIAKQTQSNPTSEEDIIKVKEENERLRKTNKSLIDKLNMFQQKIIQLQLDNKRLRESSDIGYVKKKELQQKTNELKEMERRLNEHKKALEEKEMELNIQLHKLIEIEEENEFQRIKIDKLEELQDEGIYERNIQQEQISCLVEEKEKQKDQIDSLEEQQKMGEQRLYRLEERLKMLEQGPRRAGRGRRVVSPPRNNGANPGNNFWMNGVMDRSHHANMKFQADPRNNGAQSRDNYGVQSRDLGKRTTTKTGWPLL